MSIHYLHLNPKSFEYIRSGVKTVENRLFDEKRKTYKVGDKVVFISTSPERGRIKATIVGLHISTSFRSLFLNSTTIGKYSTGSIDELLKGVFRHYSEEDEKSYGVVGIEFVVNHGE